MLLNQTDGKRNVSTFQSLEEFADYAESYFDEYAKGASAHRGGKDYDDPWRGGRATDVFNAARNGWDKHLAETLALVDDAVTSVEADTKMTSWSPVWDVTGSQVDVAEFLSGTPECMVDYPPARTTKAGRVITLLAGVCYSSSVTAEQIRARGEVLAAFALELSRVGLNTELWADISTEDHDKSRQMTHRVLVKAADDELDPSRILFAYAHPGMLRILGFCGWHGGPEDYKEACGIGDYYGSVAVPVEDMPEGTIYLPGIRSSSGAPDSAGQLKTLLHQIGLVAS